MVEEKEIEPTPKQKRFCNEYLKDLNGTQAAIRAGYSKKTANEQSTRLLAKVHIQKYLQAKEKKIEEKIDVTVEKIIREYSRIAFFDPRKLFNDDDNLKQMTELGDEDAAVIGGLDVENLYEGRGKDRENVGTLKKVKLVDKIRALDSLAKIKGLFVEKVEHSGKITIDDLITKKVQ